MAIDFADLVLRVNYSDVQKATKAVDDLTAAGAKVEQSTNRVGASTVAATRNMGAWAALQAEATGHAGEHSIAIGRLERALASYVGHALGANNATESLVAGLLKFSVGTLETVGVLAGLAAVVGLYELMTSSSREAKKQMDDMTDSLVRQAQAAEAATLRGAENLQLIAETNLQRVKGESGVGIGSVVSSLLRGKPVVAEGDLEAQSKRIADATTAVEQATINVGKAWEAANKPIKTAADHVADVNSQLIRYNELMSKTYGSLGSVGHDFSGGPLSQQFQNAQQNAQPSLLETLQKFLTIKTEPFKFEGFDKDTQALLRHTDAVAKLNERYEDAKSKFASMGGALDDFKMGLKEGITGILEQFSPSNIGKGLLDGVYTTITNAIGNVFHSISDGIRHFVFGSSGAERDAQRQAEASARAMALQIDAVTKALSGDQLGAAINALQIQLISALQAINSALPGTKNEAERNRLRAEAAAQEQQQEARARHQDELNRRYAEEDLQVRNLRALGQGDAADRLAFQEQQQREMQKAIDEGRDATYLNTLATTQNNELLAYLNGLLTDATRNAPSGFFASAYYSQFASPRSSPSDPFGTGMLPPNYPVEPPGTGAASGSGLRPPGGRSAPITVVVQSVLDGKIVATSVVKAIDQSAAATGGAGSSRSDALNRMPV